MSRLVAAELLKLRTTRVVPALVAVSVALSALMAALIVLLSSTSDISGTTGGRLVLSSGGIAAGILALLLGIVTTAGEYRHGTILPTLLTTPDRRRVTIAQIAANTVAGAVTGIASVAATLAVSLPLLALRDVDMSLSAARVAGIAVGGVTFAALSGMLGAAFGALVRNQVAAVSAALLVLFVIEPVVTSLVDGYQRYSLTGLRVAISGGAAESAGTATGGLPPAWLAALLWTGYALALASVATAVARRRDIP